MITFRGGVQMQIPRSFHLNGWWLTAWIAVAIVAVVGGGALATTDAVDGARLTVRYTARTSLVLFMLAFAASSLLILAPSRPARWLRRNRRYLGLAFAFSHTLHGLALVTLASLDPSLFSSLTSPVTYLAGGTAYLFIFLMAVMSFDRTAVLIGPRSWRWLHALGAWYIWSSFALNFGKRFAVNPAYWPAMALVVLALMIRLIAGLRETQRKNMSVL